MHQVFFDSSLPSTPAAYFIIEQRWCVATNRLCSGWLRFGRVPSSTRRHFEFNKRESYQSKYQLTVSAIASHVEFAVDSLQHRHRHCSFATDASATTYVCGGTVKKYISATRFCATMSTNLQIDFGAVQNTEFLASVVRSHVEALHFYSHVLRDGSFRCAVVTLTAVFLHDLCGVIDDVNCVYCGTYWLRFGRNSCFWYLRIRGRRVENAVRIFIPASPQDFENTLGVTSNTDISNG